MKEGIIRMAREVSGSMLHSGEFALFGNHQIERFAALVIANNPPQSSMAWQEGFEAGRLAEREACAKVCEDKNTLLAWPTYAAAIRARGQA